MDLQQIIAWVQNLGLTGWVAVAVAAVIFYLQYQQGNLARFGLKGPGASDKDVSVEDDSRSVRVLAIDSVDYLIDYFEANNCPEGAAKMREVGPFLFHVHKPVV